jgi:hypothetical protein
MPDSSRMLGFRTGQYARGRKKGRWCCWQWQTRRPPSVLQGREPADPSPPPRGQRKHDDDPRLDQVVSWRSASLVASASLARQPVPRRALPSLTAEHGRRKTGRCSPCRPVRYLREKAAEGSLPLPLDSFAWGFIILFALAVLPPPRKPMLSAAMH